MFFRSSSRVEYVSNIHKLIIPFICFGGISVVTAFARDVIVVGENMFPFLKKVIIILALHGSVPGNSALWFLLSLFIVKTAYKLLHRYTHDLIIIFICMTILIVNNYAKNHILCNIDYLSLPDWFYNSLSGLFFYSFGHLLSNKQYDSRFFSISIIVYIVISLTCFSYVDMFYNKVLYGNYTLWLVLSLSGIICINNIFKQLSKLYESKILCYLGRNSFTFFATHFIVGNLAWLAIIHWFNIVSIYWQLIIYLISFIVILPLLNMLFHTKQLYFFIGKKKLKL